MRSLEFLTTKQEVADCENFMEALDVILASNSKVWLLKAVRQINKQTDIEEMENCSEHLDEWRRYWPMTLSIIDGKVHPDVQGEQVSAKAVDHLLAGEWHLVPWIEISQMLALWKENIKPDKSAHLGDFSTLCNVKDVVIDTMKMLHLSSDGEKESDDCTATGFMANITILERRSRAMPKGSPARAQAVANYVEVFYNALKEYGARWAKQWKKPVNFKAPVNRTFADKHCFINRKFDKLKKVAGTIRDLDEAFPVLLKGGGWEPAVEVGDDSADEGALSQPVCHAACLILCLAFSFGLFSSAQLALLCTI